jgi:uncharacterized membrane protein
METAWELTLEFVAPLVLITLVMLAVGILSGGILLPVVFAGYTQSLLRMLREGRDPSIRDLFSEFRLFLPLLVLGILLAAAVIAGFLFIVLPGIFTLYLVTFFFFYTVPLMTDKRLGPWAAVRQSAAMAIQQPLFDHVVATVIYLAVIAIGSSIFIGLLFTQPLATLFMVSMYNQKFR